MVVEQGGGASGAGRGEAEDALAASPAAALDWVEVFISPWSFNKCRVVMYTPDFSFFSTQVFVLLPLANQFLFLVLACFSSAFCPNPLFVSNFLL